MLKFLIIEDEESIRALMRHTLKKNFSCLVMEAKDGEEGLQMAQSAIPNLILLDLTMPVMDGKETLQIIRNNAVLRKTPVIVMTAMNDKEVIGSLVELGISDYILKPIDIKETVKRIKKTLDKERARLRKTLAMTNEYPRNIPRLLLVEPNSDFRKQFHELFSDRLVIYDANSGSDALQLFIKHRPKFIAVSEKVGALDKKIITQRIRSVSCEDNISIFLLVADTKELSSTVFAFDAVIKRNHNSEEFASELEKLIFGEIIRKQPPYGIDSGNE